MKTIVSALLVGALTVFSLRPALAQDDAAGEAVRTTLREHPEIILEVLREQGEKVLEILEEAARGKQARRERERWEAELKKPLKPELYDAMPALGPADAPVTIVEYSDFFCKYCAQGAKTIKEIVKKHPKRVRVVYKHMVSRPKSKKAAAYFEAIALQDPEKAWKFQDMVFADAAGVYSGGEPAMRKIAAKLGLDMERLEKDASGEKIRDRIEADGREARKFKFSGTPMFVVNGVTIHGAEPLPVFEEVFGLIEKDKVSGKTASGPKIVEQ